MPISTPAARPSLVIEASTHRASIAVVADDRALEEATVAMRDAHAERLMPAIAALLQDAALAVADLGRIVCGAGPGSFTSLRVAAAIAKGLTGARVAPVERPLFAVSSLTLIVAGAAGRLPDGSYLATLDALRGERYAALVELGARATGALAREAAPSVRSVGKWRRLSAADLTAWSQETGAAIIGPDCSIDAWPQAAAIVRVWGEVSPVDPLTWEPDYGRLAEAQARRLAGSAGRSV